MKYGIFIIAALMTMASCKDELEGSFTSKHFVNGYIIMDDIILRELPNGNHASLVFEGQFIDHGALFNETAEKYGDTHYNRKLVPGSNICLLDTISTISVYAKTDFNQTHPAGSSLNEIIVLKASSPLPYIQSGYKDFDTTGSIGLYRPKMEYTPIERKLSELKADDLILICDFCILEFTEEPTSAEQTLEITLTTGDNTSVTFEREIVFD